VVKGTFVITDTQDLSGAFEGYEKVPNKSLAVLNFPDIGIMREGYDGVIGWSQEPQEEVRVMTGAEKLLSEAYRSTSFSSGTYLQARDIVKVADAYAAIGKKARAAALLAEAEGVLDAIKDPTSKGLVFSSIAVSHENEKQAH
jgi:hypothetical protein